MCCPSPASQSRSSPLGDHCSESKPAGSFRAGTVRAAFGTSISCVYFWKLQGGVLGRVSVGEPPCSLLVLLEAPGQNPFPHPSTQEAQAALSLQPFPHLHSSSP